MVTPLTMLLLFLLFYKRKYDQGDFNNFMQCEVSGNESCKNRCS